MVAALQRRGARPFARTAPSIVELLTAGGTEGVDVIHLHWVEHLLRRPAPRGLWRPAMALRAVHLLFALWLARRRGVRTVWTIHNIAPHDTAFPALERWLMPRVAGLVDVVLAHSEHAAAKIRTTYARPDVAVAFHGHYVGSYPEPRRERSEVRAELGVPQNAVMVLCFGFIKSYKRIPELVRAVRAIARSDLHLVVAGGCSDDTLHAQILEAAGDDDRVHLRIGFVPDDVVAELHHAADAAALHYRDVFSSGALMLALSMGLPAIAPADSTATEIAPVPVVRPYARDSIAPALAELSPTDDALRRRARETALGYTWEAVADAVLGPGRNSASGSSDGLTSPSA